MPHFRTEADQRMPNFCLYHALKRFAIRIKLYIVKYYYCVDCLLSKHKFDNKTDIDWKDSLFEMIKKRSKNAFRTLFCLPKVVTDVKIWLFA